ncbi:MAG: endonuclease MutS2, partial [Candidatus Eisenbacteria bacterium]|nr:endonuclease MutS2 [Candidatus Eisenbacteria bacterium]
MNAHALDVLEYDKVVRMLVEKTSFPLGEERAAALAPTDDVALISEELSRVSELRRLMDEGKRLSLEGARDVREPLARAATEGSALSPERLVDVARTLKSVSAASSFLSTHEERCPHLAALLPHLDDGDGLADDILDAIDASSFEVLDSASRELARIRRRLVATRARLDEKMESILREAFAAGSVRESEIHIRNGRRVLPVAREHRGRVKGLVHDQSGSGATLFVEPMDAVELNNELSELESAEREEVERILRELTRRLGQSSDRIARSLDALGELDFERAKAALSFHLEAVRPKLREDRSLSIRSGRHPVLLTARGIEAVVPLSVELGGEATTLVISGPNAGGKTVALKTIGLICLMAQSGMHVPAGPDPELPVFSDIFADIGDEQSIEQDLSTFSSHMRAIREIVEEADDGTLVLIDEMGAGTDPEEGASLAIAVLESLRDRKALTVATTHLGVVKNHVHNEEGMQNGSMAFDPESLEPTFRFLAGVPGASHAFTVAETMGLPRRVLDRARDLRDSDAAAIEGLLADLSERERSLSEAVERAEAHEERARVLARDYEERLKGVKDERKKIRGRALAEAREILEHARSLVEDTVKDIRLRQAEAAAIKDARARLSERKAQVSRAIEAQESAPPADDGEPPRALEPGMRIRVAGLGREGELLGVPDDRRRARVRIRGRTLEVDAEDLRPATGPEGGPSGSRVTVNVESTDTFTGELHLRGMTTDEVGDAIERFVSGALVHGFTTLRIVHGKGTGALRSKTHEVLKGMPSVKSFRLGRWGEGDTGVTVVELR